MNIGGFMLETWPSFVDPHLRITMSEEPEDSDSEEPSDPVVYPGLIRFDAAHTQVLADAGIRLEGSNPGVGDVLLPAFFTRSALRSLSEVPDIYRVVLSIEASRPSDGDWD
jgi:hypothetical protein